VLEDMRRLPDTIQADAAVSDVLQSRWMSADEASQESEAQQKQGQFRRCHR